MAIREHLESGESSRFVDQVLAGLGRLCAQEGRAETPAPPDLSDQPVTREGDTVTVGGGPASHEVDITVPDEEWRQIQKAVPEAEQPIRDPLAPAYKPGDTVYLDNTAYEITGVGLLDVQLRDPTLPIPLLRAESKETF